ncbi:MAG: two-component regulator propeller domain-containing protein [Bacteroidales bacterium]|nr:two-component regulator propeller domain-containing protein [Bacteroidales bacterium]
MKKVVFYIVFCAFYLLSFGQTRDQFAHYSVNDGLSEINVLCMLQDQKGQMWFGTFDGLNKFDGYTFKTYKGNSGDIFGLVNYRIDRIKEDNEGFIWLQTYDGRTYRFNPRTERFLQIPQCKKEYTDYRLPFDKIYTLNDGSIWISGSDNGCFKIRNTENEDSVKITHYSTDYGLLSCNKVNAIYSDKKKNTWILTNDGLNLIKQGSEKPQQLFNEKQETSFYSISENYPYIWIGGNRGRLRVYDSRKETFDVINTPVSESNIIDIKRVNAQEIFLLTNKTGFLLYNIQDHKFTEFNKNSGDGIISDNFYSCFMDKQHNIWLETDKPSVVYFETGKRKVNNFSVFVDNSAPFVVLPNFFVVEDSLGNTWVHPRKGGFSKYNRLSNKLDYFYNDPNSIDHKFSNVMHSAYSDRQGNLWLSPFSHGIEKVVFSKSSFNFYKPVPNQTVSSHIEVRSIFQDKDNYLWVGTKDGTIHIYDPQRKLLGKLCEDGKINGSKPLNASIYNITSDHNGTIWLSSKGLGLFKVVKSPFGKSFKCTITNYQYNPDDIYSLSSNAVYSAFEDSMNRLWVATYGGGINLMQTTDGEVRFISYRNKLKNYPVEQCLRTRFITEDKRNRMFVGTTSGLVAFNGKFSKPEDVQFYQYSHHPEQAQSISGNDVHYILPAKDGKIYLAIFGGGLNILDSKFKLNENPNFIKLMKSSGAPSNVIFTLKEDVKGDIWFSTQTEIAKFSPTTQKFDAYNPINNNNYNFIEASACKINNGELAYGTTEGFVIFDPLKTKKSKFIPRIIFTQFQLFNKTLEVGDKDSPLTHVIDETKNLKLNSKQNIFSIGFAAIDYTNPLNIEYAYKLEGFDSEWNYVGNHRFATYTNLPKGKYTLRVKSTNSDGVWVENERSIVIERLPSFWESSWGILLYILLFLGIMILTAYILFIILRLKNEVEVEHRISNMKLRFFTDISHELRTPLTLIASPIENILRHESISDKVKDQLEIVQRNTDRMLRLINQILDFRKIQNKKMKLFIEEVRTGTYVEEICQSFRKLAEERQIEFLVEDHSNDAILWLDKDKFEKILFNLLSNAFKFTQPRHAINVSITDENNLIVLKVTDQGEGISSDRLKTLFTRFESFATNGVSFQQSSGIGLSLTKELVEMHMAEINVQSNPGEGSSFIVSFLKGHEHFDHNKDFILNDLEKQENNHLEETKTNIEELEDETPIEANDKPVILIAEDNTELRNFLKNILSIDYEILEAENGIEALALSKEHIPDLIITDVMMPLMDGLQLSKLIKEDINISHIPLVLLTAKTDMESKLEALQYGVDDYITKPFSSAYLEARITNLLNLRKQLQNLYRSAITSGVISPSKPNVISQDDIFIQRIMKYVEDNIDNSELTIDDIVSNVNFSRSAFFKKLKSLTGLAPVEFLKEMRIQRSAQLIETGEFTISQITYMVGISDPRYFSRCFKQKFGISPREYKEKIVSSSRSDIGMAEREE